MVAGLFTTCLLSLLLPIIVLASPHASAFVKRHHGLARRAEGNVQLYQRQGGSDRFSFYNAETGSAGSCGQFLSNSGFTVAMNAAQMQASYCGLTITITYNGKSTTATVQDTCPGCPYRGLDLTPGLFSYFAAQSVGIIYGTWEFAGAPAPPPSPTPTPTPTPPPPPPSPTPTPTPTPTPSPYIPPPPASSSSSIPSISTPAWTSSSTSSTPNSTLSTTSTHNSTAALTSSSSAATSSLSIDYSSGAASGLAEPTGSNSGNTVVTPETGDNLQNLYQAFIELAAMVAAAHNV